LLLLFVTVTDIRCYELLCLNGQRKIKVRSKVLEAMMIIMIMLDISMPEMMIMIMPEMMIMMKLEMMMMFKF